MVTYDHYIGIDWSLASMAIARATKKNEIIRVCEASASITELKAYLKSLKGTVALTLEESNTSQWLYTELNDCVTCLIICEPRRNRLLTEGEKNDKVDARKLTQLLKAGLLKEVYHSADEFIYMRKLVSAYHDLVRIGVQTKNQRSAHFRSYGLNHKKDKFEGQKQVETFVVNHLDEQIEFYETKKKEYENQFIEIIKKTPQIKLLKKIPGIGNMHSLEILSSVVDIKRFPSTGHFLSYCGLIRHEKMSGGKYYGKQKMIYSHTLKTVFKMAAFSALKEGSQSYYADYYRFLMVQKSYPSHQARHAVARKIASHVYGVLKSGKQYKPKEFIEIQALAN